MRAIYVKKVLAVFVTFMLNNILKGWLAFKRQTDKYLQGVDQK